MATSVEITAKATKETLGQTFQWDDVEYIYTRLYSTYTFGDVFQHLVEQLNKLQSGTYARVDFSDTNIFSEKAKRCHQSIARELAIAMTFNVVGIELNAVLSSNTQVSFKKLDGYGTLTDNKNKIVEVSFANSRDGSQIASNTIAVFLKVLSWTLEVTKIRNVRLNKSEYPAFKPTSLKILNVTGLNLSSSDIEAIRNFSKLKHSRNEEFECIGLGSRHVALMDEAATCVDRLSYENSALFPKETSLSFNAISSEDVAMETTTTRVATGGVHQKYQNGARVPSLPKLLYVSTKDAFAVPKEKFNQHIKFVYLNKCNIRNVGPTKSSTQHYNNKDISFTLHSKNTSLTADEKIIFIFAGRGINALIPKPEDDLRIILVIDEKQREELKPYVTAGIDLLVINKLKSPTHGEYEKLGRLNSRRLTAMFCALKFKEQGIKSVMMIDDNIQSLLFHSAESSTNFSMLDYFKHMAQELTANNTVCASVVTDSNITKTYSDNSLGCKLFMFDIDKIHAKFSSNINNIFYLAYPSKANHFWGEDYFFQLMLDVTFNVESKGFLILNPKKFALQRSAFNRNSCRAVVNKANDLVDIEWYDLFYKDSFYMLNEAKRDNFAAANQGAYDLLIYIIKKNIGQYQKSLARVKTANLMREHALANKIKYEEPGEIQSINDSDFLTEFSNQITVFLTNIKDSNLSNKLRPYQKRVLQEIGENINRGFKKGQINLAAGTGKTYVQAYIAMIALLTGTKRPVMIVAPSQLLVEQAYQDFISVFNALVQALDLPITTSQIIKIDSAEPSVGVPALAMNDSLAGLPCVFITCNASYKQLKTKNQILWEKLKPCLFLQDENHLCSKDELPVLENALVIGLSATPPKSSVNKYLQYGFNIKYNRLQAVLDKFNAPLVHRKFNCNYSAENVSEIIPQIPALLNDLTTPAGKKFKLCKGIIYVPNNKKGYSYSKTLKDNLESNGIKCFEINTENSQYKEQLEEYKKDPSSAKVLIFKGMGRVGFSYNDIEWAIDLQNGLKNTSEVYQKSCRTTRYIATKCGTYVSYADSNTRELFPRVNSYDHMVLEHCTDEYKAMLIETSGVINIYTLAAPASSRTNREHFTKPKSKRRRDNNGNAPKSVQDDSSDDDKTRKLGVKDKKTVPAAKATKVFFTRHSVADDGDCGYTAFGIIREHAQKLLKDNVEIIGALIQMAVKEQLLLDDFKKYLKETNSITSNEALKSIDVLSNRPNVLKSYIDYDVGRKQIDAGWAHPSILQALAHIQDIHLKIWQLDSDGELKPHETVQYHEYKGPNAKQGKDLLFVNNNHFELITFNGTILQSKDGLIGTNPQTMFGKKENGKSNFVKSHNKSHSEAEHLQLHKQLLPKASENMIERQADSCSQ